MKAGKGDKVKIIKKMNDWSSDYQEGDIFTVESTWYGGINVTSSTGIPLSIDEIEYEIIGKEPSSQPKGKVIFYAEDKQGLERAEQYAQKLCEENAVCNVEILAVNHAIKGLLSSEDNQTAFELHAKGVKFFVCEISIKELELTNAELVSLATTVPFGVLTLIEKQEEGYAYIRV